LVRKAEADYGTNGMIKKGLIGVVAIPVTVFAVLFVYFLFNPQKPTPE
jgi:hypothetical protein